jgi:hypothetical protein
MEEDHKYDYEYKKSNREKRMTPKSWLFWCDSCDAQLVGSGSKCDNCGVINGSNVLKKETSSQ